MTRSDIDERQGLRGVQLRVVGDIRNAAAGPGGRYVHDKMRLRWKLSPDARPGRPGRVKGVQTLLPNELACVFRGMLAEALLGGDGGACREIRGTKRPLKEICGTLQKTF